MRENRTYGSGREGDGQPLPYLHLSHPWQIVRRRVTCRDFAAAAPTRAVALAASQRRSVRHVCTARPRGGELIRPELRALVDERMAAGHQVAILTNDLTHFHPQSWVDRISILHEVDHLIDLSHTDYLKPDPRAFEVAAETLGLPASQSFSSQPHSRGVLIVSWQPLRPAPQAPYPAARSWLRHQEAAAHRSSCHSRSPSSCGSGFRRR